jgi:glycosyltransferase involved in cell wall biosynthesis
MRCFALSRKNRYDLVHCRSYVPSVIGLLLKKLFGSRFLFDMRGFWVDERVDGGIWRSGSASFRISKWFERRFLENADVVVTLTRSAVKELEKIDYLQAMPFEYRIIPTCVDMERFRPLASLRDDTDFVLGYLGSVGTWYLFDELLDAYRAFLQKRPATRLLIINRDDHEFIRDRLQHFSVPTESVEVLAGDYEEVPKLLARIDAGIFLIKPVYSKRASAPTRLGELLACGKPCLGNSGVGDIETILKEKGVGICVDEISREAIVHGLTELADLSSQQDIAARCRESAGKYFSLDMGVSQYSEIYGSLEAKP